MQMPEKAVRGLDLLKESTRIDMGDVADQALEFIDYYRHIDAEIQKWKIRQGIGLDYSTHLLALAKVEAVKAVRENSVDHVNRGLVAVALEGVQYDFRTTVMALCLLYHSAQKLGVDPVPLFQQAAAYGADKARDFMLQYLQKGDKDIRAMGMEESYGPNGFDYAVVAM